MSTVLKNDRFGLSTLDDAGRQTDDTQTYTSHVAAGS